MLLLLMGGVLPLWRQISGFTFSAIEGDPLNRGIFLSGYLLSMVSFFLYPKSTFSLARGITFVWLLILLAAISILWSDFPALSFRRVIGILLTTFYALVLYLRFPSYQSFLHLLGAAFFIAILSSLFMVVLKPDWGIMSFPWRGAWQGVFPQKNILGRVSVIALLVFPMLISDSRSLGKRVFWSSAFILSFITLIGSRSVTSLVLAGTLAFTAMFIRVARLWRKELVVFLLITLIIAFGLGLLVSQNDEFILDALGRDITLTGRVTLWQVLYPMGLKHPFGYGFGAFMVGMEEGPSAKVTSAIGWYPHHAHNGFLSLWLDLGWLGLVLGVILVAVILFQNLFPAIKGSKKELFLVLFMVFIVVYSLVESVFLQVNNFYWVLLVYAYLATGKHNP